MSKDFKYGNMTEIVRNVVDPLLKSLGNIIDDYVAQLKKMIADLEAKLTAMINRLKTELLSKINSNTNRIIELESKLEIIADSIPKEPTSNLSFYVSSTGTDKSDDGWGESSSQAFKTIQFALNHVCKKFSFGDHNCTINVASGTFKETLSIPSFNTGNGVLIITGASKTSTIIQGSMTTKFSDKVQLRNFTLTFTGGATGHCIQTESNAYLELYNVKIIATKTSVNGIWSTKSGAQIRLYTGTEFSGTFANFIDVSAGMVVICNPITLSGTTGGSGFYAANSGSIVGDAGLRPAINGNFNGRKYYLEAGGLINSQGHGANWIPGSQPGVNNGGQYF